MNYRHFIITRFNLRSDNDKWKTDKQGKSVLTDEWLRHRINLFMKYCLPSVLNQSCPDFKWLLYLDSSTSEQVRQEFIEIEKINSQVIKIIYADGFDEFEQRYGNDVIGLCENVPEYIITTRLDNDDIVHKDFIRKIREKFNNQEFIAINFLKIIMMNPEKRNKIHIDYGFSNHFVSVAEKVTPAGIKGCYSRGDRFWNKKGEIIQITDKPYVLEIISERNLLNNFRGFPVLKTIDLSDFHLEGLKARNSIFDPYLIMVHKMSWIKFFQSLRYRLAELNPGKRNRS